MTVALSSARGTATIIEFRSVVDAVRCAIEVQNGMVDAMRVCRKNAASIFASASISGMSWRRATAI